MNKKIGLDGNILYEDDNKIIIFLNGSNHWYDWILNFWPKLTKIYNAKIHTSWYLEMLETDWLHELIDHTIINQPDKKIYLLGYSAGGEGAELFAWFAYHLYTEKDNLKNRLFLHLFGAPCGIELKGQKELYKNISVIRYKNKGDIVPWYLLLFRKYCFTIKFKGKIKGHAYLGYENKIIKVIEKIKSGEI
jgi:hypothetical protein